jgi:hypothetical protein
LPFGSLYNPKKETSLSPSYFLPFDRFIKPIKMWIIPKNKRWTNKSGEHHSFLFN